MKRILTLLADLSLTLLIGGCLTIPQNGPGMLKFADGGSYVGEFKDGKYNGQGTYTFANGSKYVGEYKDSPF